VSVLGLIRPDSWNFPLFVHVLGAMVLVGALVLVLLSLLSAWRNGSLDQVRLAYKGLLYGVLPSWIVMRVGAQLIADKEFPKGSDEPAWLGIGYGTAEPGLLLLVIATVLVGLQVRKARSAEGGAEPTASRAATVLVSLMLVAYIVAIWAMTTKPR
jgi:hypothetical protein